METLWEKLGFALVALAISAAVFHERVIDYLRPEPEPAAAVAVAVAQVRNLQRVTEAADAARLELLPAPARAPEPVQQEQVQIPERGGINKCKVQGRVVYTDDPCAAIGGTGGTLDGGIVSQVDSSRHDGLVRDMNGKVIGRAETDGTGQVRIILDPTPQPRQPDRAVVASVKSDSARSRNFQLCSDLNKRRIDYLRNGMKPWADRIDEQMKDLRCMSTS